MLSQAGEGAGVVAPAVPQIIPEPIPEPMPETDQPQDHLTAPPRQQTSDPIAPVFEHGQSSDPDIASFSQVQETNDAPSTSTNVEDEPLGGSFHASPPRSTPASPAGHTSGGAEHLITLTALSSVVSTLVQRVNLLETELKDSKQLFKDVVGKLVKQVKAMEVKLKTKKRKVVVSDSDKEDGGEQDVDLDALHALANAAVTVDSTKSPGGASSNPAACSYDPTSDVPTTDVPTDVPSGVAPTGPSTVSPGSTTVPTSSSIPAAEPIPARSGTTTATPSSPVKDARKGKGVAVEEPTPTQDKTFKQLEEERLGWEAAQRLQAQELVDFEKQRAESLMKDANLARQMSQDFEMTEDQRKRQQEVLASAANYSDAAWDKILARLQANPDLSSTIFGVDFTDNDFAAKMVDLVTSRRKELAEQRAQERRDMPMTPAQLRQYMRTYVKNQGPAVYTTGWTMAQVRKLSPEQLQEEFDKIQRAVAFTRGLKRDGSPMTRASSKKLKTGDVAVDVEAPSHSVPQEVEGEAPSQDVSREEVDAPSHSQDIPEAQVKVPSQEPTAEDVPKAQPTVPSLKKVGTKKKLLGRKGVHTSQSTIPIEEGDPDAEHKLCIKYASDEDSASDCDTPVHLYAVVDWELLPTGLGSINAIYRLDNSRKYFTSLREILHLGDLQILMDSPEVNDGSDFWKNQHTWSIQSWKLYSFSGVHVLETVSGLVIHMFVDKKYPLSINLIERMLDHQLEIAVQLIAFLKKQISNSKRPKVHEWVFSSPMLLLMRVEMVINPPWIIPLLGTKGLASPEQTATTEVVPKSVAGSSFFAASSMLLPFNVQVQPDFRCSEEIPICADVSCVQVKTQADWMLLSSSYFNPQVSTSRYVVPTGRVVDSTGRYVVPAGKVIIIVSPGRQNLVPTGRILSPEPFVFNQDPGENSSQRPPHIDHHCCYGCGDSLDGIFCQRCTCESCGNGAHYGYNCPPKVPTISNPEPCHNQNVDEFPQTLPSFHPTCYSGDGSSFTYDSTPNFVDDSPNVFNPPSQPPTYSCEFCGNDAHYGYDCPPQVPFIYNPEPCYNQDFNFPQNFQCFQQQYICCTRCGGPHETFQCQQVIFYEPCCENYGGPHETFQCQPMNENYYEPNFCYNSNSFGFDQFQPSQFIIDHIDSMNDHLKAQQVLNDSMSKLRETFQTWLQQRQEQVVNLDTYTPDPSQYQKIPIYYDDDDDEESSIPLRDIIISELPSCIAIKPILLTEEPVIDSLFDEFTGELITIPPIIFNREHEEYISLMERLLYDNSSPRPPEDFHANPNTIIESLPTFPIPVEDSDSLREEIDIFPCPDDSIPPCIESDDYDSEGGDNSTSLPEFESFHVDYPDSGD
ncbi:hypothetical protein Tco_0739391 [Tanacetum coccineum]